MGRLAGFSTIQREELKQLVFDCYVQKATVQETIDKIQSVMNVKVTEIWIDKIRKTIRNSARTEMAKYAKNRYAYIQKYFDRIHAVEALERKCWRDLRRNYQDELVHLKYISEMREIQILLTDLYNNLPQITNIKRYNNNNENTNQPDIQQQEAYSEDNNKL